MLAMLLGSIAAWQVTRDRVPRTIRIATGARGGLYYAFAQSIAPQIEKRTGSRVELLETEGSGANRDRVIRREAELAILQLGAASLEGLAVVAPIYRDVVFVVARRERGIHSIADLVDRRVLIGLPESGMRSSATALLSHYGIDPTGPGVISGYFLDLTRDESLDAAIVTTGYTNADLKRLLETCEFDLLDVDEEPAFCLTHPAFDAMEIPKGLYGHRPAFPLRPVATVATYAVLVATDDASAPLVMRTLEALYTSDVRSAFPTLRSAAEASRWTRTPLHPSARDYFDPYRGIDTFASFMESLAAGKELIFALGALLYLIFDRYRRLQESERIRDIRRTRERLDALLADTARIERAQMETTDTQTLKDYLDEVTRVKLRAIEELSGEGLRGDRMFLIFLTQCGNVINKIQAKISLNRVAAD